MRAGIDGGEVGIGAEAGAIDQQIDLLKPLQRRHHALQSRIICQVGRQHVHTNARAFLQCVFQGLQYFAAPGDDQKIEAPGRQGLGEGRADAGGRPVTTASGLFRSVMLFSK